ncbi:hypothetical protein [Pseudoxanthomonas dokdonensis]|nr:hypothetical protein [Pseudoxanthomonas dokdonensis]
MTARTRNLILLLSGGALALVLLGYITGADWLAWVLQLAAGLGR